MSKKKLTLEEAKKEIRKKAELQHKVCRETIASQKSAFHAGFENGCKYALDILHRVHVPVPDEEDQAALWLSKECAWHVARWGTDPAKWRVAHISDDYYWLEDINPIEEAKKMGWEGTK